MFYFLLVTNNIFNETNTLPVVINAPPFSFYYERSDSDYIILLVARLGANLKREPGVVYIESALIKIKYENPLLKEIDNSMKGNDFLKAIPTVALSVREFAHYSEFTNDVAVTNTSETDFTNWGPYQVFDEPAVSIQFSNKGYSINGWTSEDFRGLNIVEGNESWRKGSDALTTVLLQENIEYTVDVLLAWAKKLKEDAATAITDTSSTSEGTTTTTSSEGETTTASSEAGTTTTNSEAGTSGDNSSTEKETKFWKSTWFIVILVLGVSLVMGGFVAVLFMFTKSSSN